MGKKEIEILHGISTVLPSMSEAGRERLLGFVDGIAFATEKSKVSVEQKEKDAKQATAVMR